MITGRFTGLHIFVPVIVIGASGQDTPEFLMDTGFAGFLTMPFEYIVKLGLTVKGIQPSELADGTEVQLDIYSLQVLWDGEERTLDILELPGIPLIGMALLKGSDIHIEAVEDGLVTIKRRQ